MTKTEDKNATEEAKARFGRQALPNLIRRFDVLIEAGRDQVTVTAYNDERQVFARAKDVYAAIERVTYKTKERG